MKTVLEELSTELMWERMPLARPAIERGEIDLVNDAILELLSKRARLAREATFVFLCVPEAAAAELAPPVLEAGVNHVFHP